MDQPLARTPTTRTDSKPTDHPGRARAPPASVLLLPGHSHDSHRRELFVVEAPDDRARELALEEDEGLRAVAVRHQPLVPSRELVVGKPDRPALVLAGRDLVAVLARRGAAVVRVVSETRYWG